MSILYRELFVDSIKFDHGRPENQNYFFDLPVVKNLKEIEQIEMNKRVTFFVGENGTGKSTLLEAVAVACGFNAEGGTRNFNFSTFSSHSDLSDYLIITRGLIRPKDGFFLRAESFYNVASYIEELDNEPGLAPPIIGSYGGVSLHGQSHGESFMSLILNRFGGNGLYILDEPEAALSPSRQMALLVQINKLVQKNSQFIIATHSPILLAYPDADIFELSDSGINLTPYKETEHYVLTREFINNPDRMLNYLFEEG